MNKNEILKLNDDFIIWCQNFMNKCGHKNIILNYKLIPYLKKSVRKYYPENKKNINFDNYKFIEHSAREVYFYYNSINKTFIKFTNSSNNMALDSIKRDFIVGTFLHSLYPKNFINILDYTKFNCNKLQLENNSISICEGFISKKIEGIPITNFYEIKTLTFEQFKDFLLTIFVIIYKLNKIYKFTHHDLGEGNIFFGIDEGRIYPIIMDFEFSYIEIPKQQLLGLIDLSYEKTDNKYISISSENFIFNGETGPIIKEYLISDFVNLLKSCERVFSLDYINIFEGIKNELNTRQKESEKEFINLKINNVEDFVFYMNKYQNLLKKIYGDDYEFLLVEYQFDMYKSIDNKLEIEYNKIVNFCKKCLDILKKDYSITGKYDEKYNPNLVNIDLSEFIIKIKNIKQ